MTEQVIEDIDFVEVAREEVSFEAEKQETAAPLPVKEKKPFIRLEFPANFYLQPPAVLFIGTSNVTASYKKWLEKLLTSTLHALGDNSPNSKGQPKKAYMDAVRTFGVFIHIARAYDEHEEVMCVYSGPKFPKQVDFLGVIKEVVLENSGLILALGPYYVPVQPTETPEVAEAPEAKLEP